MKGTLKKHIRNPKLFINLENGLLKFPYTVKLPVNIDGKEFISVAKGIRGYLFQNFCKTNINYS